HNDVIPFSRIRYAILSVAWRARNRVRARLDCFAPARGRCGPALVAVVAINTPEAPKRSRRVREDAPRPSRTRCGGGATMRCLIAFALAVALSGISYAQN